jgi:hypothetical protein
VSAPSGLPLRARAKRLAGPPDARGAEPWSGSAKVGATRIGDEGEELLEFLAGLKSIAAQIINRVDRARTRSLPDELRKRHQALITRVQRRARYSFSPRSPSFAPPVRPGWPRGALGAAAWLGVPLLKRRVSVILTLLACMGWIGLVVEGSLPAISILPATGPVFEVWAGDLLHLVQALPRTGKQTVFSFGQLSKPSPARWHPQGAPQGQAWSPVSYSKHVHELVELRGFEPRTSCMP